MNMDHLNGKISHQIPEEVCRPDINDGLPNKGLERDNCAISSELDA